MIRVLHVLGKMNMAGIETFIMNIYRNIDRNKCQFDFLIHSNTPGDYDDEIKALGGYIFYITPRGKSLRQNKKDLDNFFRSNPQYQIVHQHVSSLSYIKPLQMAKKNGVKIRIIHAHSTRAENKMHHILHRINSMSIHKIATHYFTCSDIAGKWLYGKSQVPMNKVMHINNAIDISKFVFNNNIRQKVRQEYQLTNKFVIGHVGRFDLAKNHDFIVDIFHEVHKKNKSSILMLVGKGNLRNMMMQKVEGLGLSNSVRFVEGSKEVYSLMQAMDIFLFPSIFEGLGIVLVEAQAAGLKCIVSNNVPTKIKMTQNIEFIALEEGEKFWADQVLKYDNDYTRENMTQHIKDAGYDIYQECRNLQDFYLNQLDD